MPAGADIYLDGKNAGKSPHAFFLTGAKDKYVHRDMAIKMDGYVTAEGNLSNISGDDIALDIKMERLTGTSFTEKLEESTVAAKLGEPIHVEKVAAKLPAYLGTDLSAQIRTNIWGLNVSSSETATKNWDIATVGHVITDKELPQMVEIGLASRCRIVTTPPGAEILIEGNDSGKSPQVFYLMRHADVPRIIAVKMEGYVTVERNFVPDGKDFELDLQLEKK